MIYTEEDLQEAYAMGYNEAVDDANEYFGEESMEFSLDDDYAAYDEDYSAVEDMIYNEGNVEHGSPEWMKRHDISNMRRTAENKFHMKNDDVYHRTDYTPQQMTKFAKKYSNSRWAKEGRDEAKRKYNERHERMGDGKRWRDVD